MGSVFGWGRFHEEVHGNPLQYSCLGNPMDREACWAIVHKVAKSRMRLSDREGDEEQKDVSMLKRKLGNLVKYKPDLLL